MAVQTAATSTRESVGSMTLHIFTFTSVTTGDTFASGLGGNVVGFFGQTTSITTQASAGFVASNSSGTFTFKPGEDSNALTFYVLART